MYSTVNYTWSTKLGEIRYLGQCQNSIAVESVNSKKNIDIIARRPMYITKINGQINATQNKHHQSITINIQYCISIVLRYRIQRIRVRVYSTVHWVLYSTVQYSSTGTQLCFWVMQEVQYLWFRPLWSRERRHNRLSWERIAGSTQCYWTRSRLQRFCKWS